MVYAIKNKRITITLWKIKSKWLIYVSDRGVERYSVRILRIITGVFALEVNIKPLLISLYLQSIGVFSTNTKSISWPTKMRSVSSNNGNQDPNRIVTEVRYVSI